MNIVEFGAEHKDTIILLHGGGLSWWNYRESAMLLQNEYHIVLPILDGHAGSDRPFTTIEENASEIISFVVPRRSRTGQAHASMLTRFHLSCSGDDKVGVS